MRTKHAALLAAAFAALAASAPAQAQSWIGSPQSGWSTRDCPYGMAMIGIWGYENQDVESVGALCLPTDAPMNDWSYPNFVEAVGGVTARQDRVVCPPGQFVGALQGRADRVMARLEIWCAPWNGAFLDPDRATLMGNQLGGEGSGGGVSSGPIHCEGGFLNGLDVSAGGYVVAVRPRCGSAPPSDPGPSASNGGGGGGRATGAYTTLPIGGRLPADVRESRCRDAYVIGVYGRTGAWVDRLGVICGVPYPNGEVVLQGEAPALGGSGGGYNEAWCPTNTVATAVHGSGTPDHLLSLQLTCVSVRGAGGDNLEVRPQGRSAIFGPANADGAAIECNRGELLRGLEIAVAQYVHSVAPICDRARF